MEDGCIEENIIFIGDSGVGKTSISKKMQNIDITNVESTIGANYYPIDFEADTTKGRICIWDTAGQENFRSLAPMYLRKGRIVVLVYEIDSRKSFESIMSWYNIALENNDKIEAFILVGNKTDLANKAEVSENEGWSLAKVHNFQFLQTSANTNDNIPALKSILINTTLQINGSSKPVIKLQKRNKTQKDGCC